MPQHDKEENIALDASEDIVGKLATSTLPIAIFGPPNHILDLFDSLAETGVSLGQDKVDKFVHGIGELSQ